MKGLTGLFATFFFALGLLGPAVNAAGATLPEHQATRGFGVMYVSGGSTADSRARMQRMAGDYDLHITLASARDDEDYGDARVMVGDATGAQLLNASAAGPMFFVQIPPGDYTVSADLNGRHLVKTARITPQQTTRLTFDWRS